MIRNRKFCERKGFAMYNKPYYLSKLSAYELKDELKKAKEHYKDNL